MSNTFNPDGLSTDWMSDAQFDQWLADRARDWTATITVTGANREFLMVVRARDLGNGAWRVEPDPTIPPPAALLDPTGGPLLALLDALRAIASRDDAADA